MKSFCTKTSFITSVTYLLSKCIQYILIKHLWLLCHLFRVTLKTDARTPISEKLWWKKKELTYGLEGKEGTEWEEDLIQAPKN